MRKNLKMKLTSQSTTMTPEKADELLAKAVQEDSLEDEYLDAIEKVNAELKKQGAAPMEINGVSGAPIFDGFISHNETNAKLTGSQKYVTYNNILVNTSIVGAGVRYFLNMLGNAKWSVTAADESEEAQGYADFVQDVMDDMHRPWTSVVRKGAMYRFFGFSLQEWIPKMREDGRIGFFDVAARPQSTIEQWKQDKNGYIDKVIQRDPVNGSTHDIDMWKMVYLVDDTLSDSPEGLGIFRHLVKSVDMLTRYLELEGFGFETDLRGIPVGKAPLSIIDNLVASKVISKAQRTAILAPLKGFISNHIRNPSLGMIMDSNVYSDQSADVIPSMAKQWDLSLLTAQSSSQGEIANAIDRVTHEIARTLGVQQLLLGSGKVGTQALSKDNSKNFLLIVASSLKELEKGYQAQLWDRLWELNGFPQNMKPSVVPEDVQLNEVESITKALKDLAQSGAVLAPNDPAINEIRQLLGLAKAPHISLEEYLELTGKKTELPGGEKTTPSQVSGKTEDEKE